MGFDNVQIVIPCVRMVAEEYRVLGFLAENGLKRGEHGLQMIMSCDTPANALLADTFLEHCVGFSIGFNATVGA